MTTKYEIEIWVAMNEDGDVEVDTDKNTAVERLSENFGATMIRLAKITTAMAAPVVVEASVTVPDEAGETLEATAA